MGIPPGNVVMVHPPIPTALTPIHPVIVTK